MRSGTTNKRLCTVFLASAFGVVCLVGSRTVAAVSGQLPAATIAFSGARIIDGTGAEPLDDGIILVRDGRIVSVGVSGQVTIPGGARVVDLTGRTVMPGLINAHGHVADDTEEKLELYARYGVTTVVSLGGEGSVHVGLTDRQDEPGLDRARLHVAGPNMGGANSIRAASDRLADLIALGVEWVKIRVEGGGRGMPEAVFASVIDEAHRNGLRVAVHMYDLADAKRLVARGVDLLAHSVRDALVDEELIELMRSRGACLAPTLTRDLSTFVYDDTPEFFSDPFFGEHPQRASAERLVGNRSGGSRANADAFDVAMRNVKLLSDAGVTIALGTDSGASTGRFPGYFEHLEMELMAEAGMAPMEILLAATGEAAACLGLEGSVGTLVTGAWADFLVTAADPLEDIRNTKTLESVWIAGNRVR